MTWMRRFVPKAASVGRVRLGLETLNGRLVPSIATVTQGYPPAEIRHLPPDPAGIPINAPLPPVVAPGFPQGIVLPAPVLPPVPAPAPAVPPPNQGDFPTPGPDDPVVC